MDKRYKNKGLTVIGEEVQGSSKDDIAAVAKDHRIGFSITKGSTRPSTMKGIPHAVVFDASGKLIFAGHPADDNFDRTVKKALRGVDADSGSSSGSKSRLLPDAPKPVIDSRTWTNEAGKKITASVLSIDGDKVKFKLSNGKEVNYPIAKLSDEDQELIKESGEKEEEDE